MKTESDFLNKAHALFTESTANVDVHVLTRLRQARTQAVAEAETRSPVWRARPWALPAGAAAIVCALVVAGIVWWNLGVQPSVPFAANNGEDMAIVLSNDNLDMYADMDFYQWLQAQQQQQNPSQTDSGANNNG